MGPADEPGIAALAVLSKTLERNAIQDLALEFPSLGIAEPILCRCAIHALADGRDGVLDHGTGVTDAQPLATA